MTQQEFKAWFEGFTEAMDGAPSKKQWERIKARIKAIDGEAMTERVFIDRYWPHYVYGGVMPTWTITAMVGQNTCGTRWSADDVQSFNSVQAISALGRAEYHTIC